MSKKIYLGDAVYAEIDYDIQGGRVTLTTEDGIRTTNTIYLSPEVFGALLEWYDSLFADHDHK